MGRARRSQAARHRPRRRLVLVRRSRISAISISRRVWSPSISATATPAVANAIGEQARRLAYVAPTFANDQRALLAQAIVELAPWTEGGRVFFTTGGGEANEDAMKFARTLTRTTQDAHRVSLVSRLGTGRGNADRREPPMAERAGHSRRRAFLRAVSVSQPVSHARSARRGRARHRASRRDRHLRRRRPHRGAAHRTRRRQQRRHRLSGKLSRARSRALRSLRNLARLRRGDDRIRAHRRSLRRATLRRDARYIHLRQRRHVGVRSARRRRRARIARGATSTPTRSQADIPSAAIRSRWRPASRRCAPIARSGSSSERARSKAGCGRASTRCSAATGSSAKRAASVRSSAWSWSPIATARTPLVPWQGKASLQSFFNDLLARGLYVFGRYNVAIIAPPLIVTPQELDEAFETLDAALTRLESTV